MSCVRGLLPSAFAAVLAAACSNESINVLSPRDAAVDASVDASVDANVVDGPPPTDALPPTDAPPTDAPPPIDAPPPTDGPPPIDPPTTGCLTVGAQCSSAGACCLLSCPNVVNGPRVCAAGPVCASAGEPCASNIDCCSDSCMGAICVGVATDRCRPAGEQCTTDGECCGTRCISLSGAPARCALLGACRVQGEVCRTQTDCCSGRCDDDQGRRVCLEAPPCGLGGSTCRGQAGDRCVIDGDCCTGACSVRPEEGVRRCAAPACGDQCALCTEDRDCCTGRCVWDESGYRRCEN